MRYKNLCLAALILLFGLVLPATVFAGTATVDGIIMTTPNTYHACSDSTTFDTITATNLTATHQLIGQVIVNYITDTGPQLVPGGFYSVNHSGPANFSLQVSYPPIAQWPVQSNGTAEIHVDVQIEVYVNRILVGTLGPGIDWDVFCLDPAPPPPPPPPPNGTEGCTPGYWKNHLEAWGSTGYASGNDFDTVFGVNLFNPNISLETAVNLGGGGVNRLARHGVAALLSAAHSGVDSPYTVAEVIALVQAGNADALEAANELGCPL